MIKNKNSDQSMSLTFHNDDQKGFLVMQKRLSLNNWAVKFHENEVTTLDVQTYIIGNITKNNFT